MRMRLASLAKSRPASATASATAIFMPSASRGTCRGLPSSSIATNTKVPWVTWIGVGSSRRCTTVSRRDGDRAAADLADLAVDRHQVADLDRLDEGHGGDRHRRHPALGHPGRQGAAGDVHLRQHPAAENIAVSVHVGGLGHGPDDRVARLSGISSPPDVVDFQRFSYHTHDRTGHQAIPSRGRGKTRSSHGEKRRSVRSVGRQACRGDQGHFLHRARYRGAGGARARPQAPRHVYRRHRRAGDAPPRRRGARQRHGRGGRRPRRHDPSRAADRQQASWCATTAAACRSTRIPSSRTSRRSRSSSPCCIRAASSTARSTRPPAACTASASRWSMRCPTSSSSRSRATASRGRRASRAASPSPS